ncbi:MAG TPA: gliding motility protein GldM [Flavisolibacter sp.]
MALPKEPRQKMINLMYLVLTALLALNVSAEILNAFKTVDSSLNKTNTTITNSTETIMKSFEDKLADGTTRAKAEIWYPKAKRANELSIEMYNYIDQLRTRIHKEAGFDPAKKGGDSTFKEDNQDIATNIMVKQGEGKKLRDKLENYKKQLLEIDPILAQEFSKTLQVDVTKPVTLTKANKSWEEAYFYMVPTVAAMAMLRKFQNDVKTSENRVVAFLHEQVGKVVVRFDTYTAIVGQSSNYVMPGQEVEVMAGVGAFSKAAKPQISINGQNVALGEDGAARLKVQGGSLGAHRIPVNISYVDQEGKPQSISKVVEYTVGQSNASIALDKMNVLYMGIANPITVAASGGGDDKIKVSIEGGGGRLDKTAAGKYNAYVTSGDVCHISVMVDGKLAGRSQFRIRRIPTPVGTVGGYASGDNVNAGAFKSQAGVGAYIKDFPFDLKYTVTSFVLSTDSDEGDIIEANVSGNTWGASGQAQNVLRQVKAGKTVYIDNIRATGEDGRSYKLPSLVYYIK